MQRRKLGQLEVSAVGLGCATMTPFYGVPDPVEALATLRRAAELGVDMLDTADAYGGGRNEELIAQVLRDRRSDYIVATKFGNIGRNPDGSAAGEGRPDHVRTACERSLERLGTEIIDLYYIHRVDPKVPIEETVSAMSDLVRAGKVRFLGICEAGPETIRRAHAVHPLAAVQIEYSLWSREVEQQVLPLCRELGIGFVAYSPLGRGFLTGTVAVASDLGESDARRNMPRFRGENLQRNRALVGELRRLAADERYTPAQLARSPGCCRVGPTSCRFPEPAIAIGSTKTRRRRGSRRPRRRCGRWMRFFGRGTAAGPRYPEAYARTLGI